MSTANPQVLPQSKLKVLEEGDAALIAGSDEAVIVDDDAATVDEIASFDDLLSTQSSVPAAEKPAAVVAPAKPAAAAAVPAAAAASGDDEVPAEYKGKSLSQVIKMHRDAQQVLGRQGSELGELRRTADMAIRIASGQQRAAAAAPAAAPAAKPLPEESDIFARPIEAINTLIENHPLLKNIKDTMGQTAADNAARAAQQNTERFARSHPDFQQILGDPEFREWVNASPVRRQLLSRAHSRFDFDAGDEVFSTWKALKSVKNPAPTGAQDDAAAAAAATGIPSEAAVKAAARTLAQAKQAKQAASAAGVPTGGSSAPAGKTNGGKKIFRRADLIRLSLENPDRFEELSGEIDAAYRENRVR